MTTKNSNNDAALLPLLPKENLTPTNPKFYQKAPVSICKSLIEIFSTNNRQRHPSWANKECLTTDNSRVEYDHPSYGTIKCTSSPIHVRLITIGPSHFCEKARWGLDVVEAKSDNPFYYTEDAHPPIFAGIATLEASKGKASMTPMVVYNNKNNDHDVSDSEIVLYDSSKILQHFCPHLYPIAKKDEIVQLESYFGSHLGATARVLFYHHMFQPPYQDMLVKSITIHSSWIETFLWSKLINKGLGQGMKKAMNINNESAKLSLETIRQLFHDVSEKLKIDDNNDNHSRTATKNKKQYLLDTKNQTFGFTAADLTFAALASPLILPPEIGYFMDVTDIKYPKEIVDLKYELRGTLAGQHCLEMYKKHRLVCDQSNKIGMVFPKVVGRNRIPPSIYLASFIVTTLGVAGIIDRRQAFRSKL